MLSTNEVRARAAQFAEEWKDAEYEKGETQSFYDALFHVFGVKRRLLASFEKRVQKFGGKPGFIDLFWPGQLLVEQKSAGRSLTRAKEQAFDYFPGIKPAELPRFVLLSDFQTFELHDLDRGTEVRFALRELPDHIEAFDFIRGREKREYKDQDPVNVEASELLGDLHDALEASGYVGHDLERFLVRLVFCLFADDTGIFDPRDILAGLLEMRTNEDGSDTGLWLAQLFQVLNTPLEKRQKNLDEDLAAFPYVNGDLFADHLQMPSFDTKMRRLLLDACGFHWAAISPAIFGALFQSVMDTKERRQKGAHYTSEQNILKVIEPLFMEDLRAEFEHLRARRDNARVSELRRFHDRLAAMRFLDPACGCGNFLIIAYRELRRLEIDLLKEIHKGNAQQWTDISELSKVDVDQFYGIEIEEFSARIAEIALWMMDHIMNNELSRAFGQAFARIPLKKSPHILHADALDADWNALLPAATCSHVFGNPPFAGSKYQTETQRAQVRRIANLGGTGGTLDFVCAWFLRAGEYIKDSTARIGFVATNSITQGEQVAQLWPLLFDRCTLEVDFAHRTFQWDSDARGKAHVHVVILGLSRRDQERKPKRLFSYDTPTSTPVESQHGALSPYLVDAAHLTDRHLVVREHKVALCEAPKLVSGCQPIDDGNYILDEPARDTLLLEEPLAEKFVRPYVGAEEYLYGIKRWILSLQSAPPQELRAMPEVMRRMKAVSAYRGASKRKGTLAIASMPTRYNVEVIPKRSFLLIPKVSSERRDYVPIGWLEPPTIPSDLVFVADGVELWHFAIITSRMHMAWLREIGGRLKSDYRYSIGVVYNTFPWPSTDGAQQPTLEGLAQKVLDARAEFPGSTLADLYDATAMPSVLRKAHQNLDAAVDRLYRSAKFNSDRERVEHLFERYEKLVTPLLGQSAAPKKSRKKA